MTSATALISGAGIAGPTLAFWLARRGWQVTLVERAQGLRSSGNPVDIRGPAVPVARQMGILPRLREAATHATAMRVVDVAGRRIARIPMPAAKGDEVEVPRGDLATILFAAVREDAELLLDDTVTAVRQDAGGVDVTFEHAAPRRFDVLIGSDGLHSTVRRLVFGPETRFVEPLGLYVATMPLGGPADHGDEVLLCNTPGRLVSIHPASGDAMAAFIFRSPPVPGRRDPGEQRAAVISAYAEMGWRVPDLLDRLRVTDDFYFDAVCRVRVPSWHQGRAALLGDAASCVSLLGDGSSLAVAGAHTLATALADEPHRPALAYRRYEARHRRLVRPKQRNIKRAAGLLIPATRPGLLARNAVARLVSRA
ncbi:FAD-dependent monooxygenase [Actinoplanes sp. NPDC024001]|uniref:FAD-dependent monooxygenase n=1 Tax=Actinoplanes sp. NPDC024001 TaxID=3154598 RepID=UPI0033C1F226